MYYLYNQSSTYFDWFDARQSCWENHGELVYGLTVDRISDLELYIRDKGFANGSIFSTSGHSFDSDPPFHWATLSQPVTYDKWLPGHEPPQPCYLSLQLVDGELYMIRSWGYDQYYICEYRGFLRRLWIFINRPIVFALLMALLCVVILLISSKGKHLKSNVDNTKEVFLKSKTQLHTVYNSYIFPNFKHFINSDRIVYP